MDDGSDKPLHLPPLGSVEPHALLLRQPPDDQLLYKVMRLEDFIASVSGSYLHFSRVDRYKDFPGADSEDGNQLPKDREGNRKSVFEKAPEFSVADYYNRCRSRTYACCFSTDNSDFIWQNYGTGGSNGKVCLVFNFGKLRSALNRMLEPGNAGVIYNGLRCHQIFDINYGLIEYVAWSEHQANTKHLANPIQYTFLKDRDTYGEEKELRISLSAFGMGHFATNDRQLMEFYPHLQLGFNFRAAIGNATIEEIKHSGDCDVAALTAALGKLNIERKPDGSTRP